MRRAVVAPLGLAIGALALCGSTTPAAATRTPSPIKVKVTVVRHRATAGRPIKGTVVLTNTTTSPITVDTCAANGWLAVGLTSRTYAPSFAHTLVGCQPTVRLHPGPNRFSVTVMTTYGSCVQPQPAGTSHPTPKIPWCTVAGLPPLPAGKYVTKVDIVGLSGLTRAPNRVSVYLRSPAHPPELAAPANGAGSGKQRKVLYLSAPLSSRPLPAGTFANGRVARTVVIDGGVMVLSPPPPSSHSALTHASASADAAASTTASPGVIDPAGTALGSVRIAPALARTAKTPAGQLAWVTVIGPQLGVNCLNTEGSVEPSFHVLVIAASGASAAMFTSRGTAACGGAISPPSLGSASKIESIRWQGLSSAQVATSPPKYNWTISYRLPSCGSVFDSPGIYFQQGIPSLFVQVKVPLISSPRCVKGRVSTTVFGPEDVPINAAQHAPLGVHQF